MTDGEGLLVLNGEASKVLPGDSVRIVPGAPHGVRAVTELQIIEVQIGDALSEADTEKSDWDWESMP